MPDDRPILSAEDIRGEALSSLSAIHSNGNVKAVESHWLKLWQLVREAKAASIPASHLTGGLWHLARDGGSAPFLIARGFRVRLWPQGELRYACDLPNLLNWAGVPSPGEG